MSNPIDEELGKILIRFLADIDDDMEFHRTALNPDPSHEVKKSLNKAKTAIKQLLDKARIDEVLKMRAVGDKVAAQVGATHEELSGAYDAHILKRAADLTQDKPMS